MSLTLTSKISNSNSNSTAALDGLKSLVEQIEVGGPISLGTSWPTRFAAAAEQLECDDSLDAHLTEGAMDRFFAWARN